MLNDLKAARVMFEMGYARQTAADLIDVEIFVRLMSENKLDTFYFELRGFRRFQDGFMTEALHEIYSFLNEFSLISGRAMFGQDRI